jgi:hypothetical protein
MDRKSQNRFYRLCSEQAEAQEKLHKTEFKAKDGGNDFKKEAKARARLEKVNAKLVEFALEQIYR